MRSMFSGIRSAAGSWSRAPIVNGPPETVSAAIQEEFGIAQPGVSQHLLVLCENGFATIRAEGARPLAGDSAPLEGGRRVAEGFRVFRPNLDALATEIEQDKRQRGMKINPSQSPEIEPAMNERCET